MIRLYILLTIFIPLSNLVAQSNNGAISSYEGRHFYVGFMDNEIVYGYDPNMDIFISSKYNTTITIISPFEEDTVVQAIKKNEVLRYETFWKYEHLISEEVQTNLLIEIKSRSPISVVAKNASIQSGDSYAIIPTRNWGNEYFAVSMPNDYYINPPGTSSSKVEIDKTPRLGEFLIMASEDATYVEIVLSADSFKEIPKDSTIKVILNQGESYLVKSKSVHGVKGVHDLTGTQIKSNKPVGLISGHMRTSVQQQFVFDEQLGAKDHLAEMMPPTNAWSNEYLTVPFGNGINSLFKVVAKDTINLVIKNDINVNNVKMLPGEFREFTNLDLPTHWAADGKFQVVQMMAKYVITPYTYQYDPSMVIIPPIDKMVNKVTYFASNDTKVTSDWTRKQYDFQSVIVIAEEKGRESIYVNNTNISDILGFREFISDSGKYYWQKVFVPPQNSVVNIKSDSGKFHVIAIANGPYDSYAMTVGASLFDTEEVDTEEPIIEIAEECDSFSGSIFDEKIKDFSGINVIEVDDKLTTNFSWQISEITDTTTFATISGNVIDKNVPAFIKITAIDYFGNQTEYEFSYEGAQVSLLKFIDYQEINIKKDSCFKFLLKTNADSVLLSSIDLPKDLRLDLQLPFQLPKMLYKDQDNYLYLCLNNNPNDVTSILDSMTFNFGCNYNRKVDINAVIISYNLSASNLVLPKILSTTSYCANATEYLEFKNVGNARIVLEGVNLPIDNNFTVDTLGMFPDTLLQGESIYFRDICFTSDDLGNFDYTFTLIDDQEINRKGTIFASTGAPQINNLVYDFGDTRIGSLKDTIIDFFNSGDFQSEFTLLEVNSTIPNDPNIAVISTIDTFRINTSEKLGLNFTYNPIKINDFTPYELNAKLIERWKPHDTITVQLLGKPTIPIILTEYIDLDTIEIDDFKDSVAKVITSNGNEKLTINKISKLNGDASVFEFNSSFYSSRIMDTSTIENLDIRFNGLTLGEHSITLLVESDAAPNYQKRVDTIRIRGFVKERDTLDLRISPESKEVISCNYDTLNLEVINTGNTIFRIDDIRLVSNIKSAELINTTFGQELNPNEVYKNDVLVFASGNKTEKIFYEIDVYDIIQNEDSTFITSSDIVSHQQQVLINTFGASKIDIGERFEVLFSGQIPNSIDTTVNIDFKLKTDIYNFFIDQDEVEIRFYDITDKIVKTITAKVKKDFDFVILESDEFDNFDFTNINRWELNARFLALLTSDLTGNMEIFFNLDDCFDSNSRINELDVNSICVFNYRNVNLNSYIKDSYLKTNIVANEANLTVESTDNLQGSIYIIDYMGKKYSVLEKIMFDKGKNNIILNLSNYANGKYILVVNSFSTTLTNEFIISK